MASGMPTAEAPGLTMPTVGAPGLTRWVSVICNGWPGRAAPPAGAPCTMRLVLGTKMDKVTRVVSLPVHIPSFFFSPVPQLKPWGPPYWLDCLLLNTFLPGSIDSTFVMCTCIGIGFFSTSASGVVIPE